MTVASNPFTRWDLARLRSRRSLKWQQFDPDVLPLWIAEMDTELAEPITAAVTEALASGAAGYPFDTGYPEAFVAFATDRWGWRVEPSGIRQANDVVTGLAEVLRALTPEGGSVIITPPVWPAFRHLVEHVGRTVQHAQLGPDGRLDFGTLEEAFDRSRWSGAHSALLLCSPHNPTGVVHTAAELGRLAELADRYRVRVVADEIFAPLVLEGSAFVPYLSLPGTESAVTVTAATKGWNLVGVKAALIVPGSGAAVDLAGLSELVDHSAATVGQVAHAAAFRAARDWLDAHRSGIAENRDQLQRLLAKRLPAVRWTPSAAGYLAWLDCRGLGLEDPPGLALVRDARVAVAEGESFGPGGEGFVRLNFGTAPAVLAEAVERIAAATTRD